MRKFSWIKSLWSFSNVLQYSWTHTERYKQDTRLKSPPRYEFTLTLKNCKVQPETHKKLDLDEDLLYTFTLGNFFSTAITSKAFASFGNSNSNQEQIWMNVHVSTTFVFCSKN